MNKAEKDATAEHALCKLIWACLTPTHPFLATLVALHFTPVSESVSHSFELA